MSKKVYFRADAGAGIGYGHFIRSLALADMLKSDFECVMFTQEPTPYQINEAEKVCRLVSLPADESKFEKFLEYLTGAEIVVLDNYFYTTEYQQQIKDKGCKLVCIDDIHDRRFVADVVINHGMVPAEEYDVADYTQLCIGPSYALLRAPFLRSQSCVRQEDSWTICFGGEDRLNLTLSAVTYLYRKGVRHIVAIVGDAYKGIDKLRGIEGVDIHRNLSAEKMAELFSCSANVVCSASTVCYEALSQGCKVYAGWYVDNQEEIYQGLVDSRLVVPLGDLVKKDILIDERIATRSFSVFNVRSRYIDLFRSEITIRRVKMQDAKLLFEWVNDEIVRKSAFNTNLIGWSGHLCWLQKRLEASDTRMYICYHDGSPFGQVRFEQEDDDVELDYSIEKSYRGKGLSLPLLQKALDQLHLDNSNVSRVIARAKVGNLPSQKALEKANFLEIDRNNDYITYAYTY